MPAIIALIIIDLFLFIRNYIPGTYLLGWDNVMPEFNIGLNWQRALTSVWQEYRGLGLLDGMAHSANLLHTLYIAILSVVFPQSMLRYVCIVLTHLAGGIGFYLLVKHLTKNNKSAFVGALFYMFNLGIIQMYFAPLEVFAVHFSALPFLALLVTKCLEKPEKKYLLLLFLTSILATPQAFVPTVFIAFFIFFLFLLLFNFLSTKNSRLSLLLFLIVFCANAFWLIPYLYQAKYNAAVIPNTRINEFSSEEIYYRNQAFGNIIDVLSLKGFMMNSVEYDTKNQRNVYFLEAWRQHTDQIIYKIAYSLIFAVSLLGLWKIIRGRKKEYWPYVASFCVALFVLANNTPIIGQLYSAVRNLFPLVGEILRIPFTKFITLFVFCLAVFFTYGANIVIINWKRLRFAIVAVLSLLVIYTVFPIFQGQFFSPLLKVSLPPEYLSMMDYMNQIDENERVVQLPAYTFWNWEYRNWGQRGSGFIWYGIKQPIALRAFDPWSQYNEQFYNELSYALNSQNITLFDNVIRKYNIGYFLLDKTMINSLTTQPINYNQLEKYLIDSGLVTVEKQFGQLILYRTKTPHGWIYTLDENTPAVVSGFAYTETDRQYAALGNYVDTPANSTYLYPFNSLYTGKLQNDIPWQATNTGNNIILENRLLFPTASKSWTIELPSLFAAESLIPVNIAINNGQLIFQPLYPSIFVNGQEIIVKEEPLILYPTIITNPVQIKLTDSQTIIKPGQNAYILNNYINTIELSDGHNTEYLTLDTSDIKRNPITATLANNSISDIKIVAPKIPGPFTYKNLIKNKGYSLINPDQQVVPLIGENPITKVESNNNQLSLEAINNAIRVVVWKDNLYHNASYIVFAKTQFFSGLPITFYLDNPFEKRAELETRLTKTNGQNVIIIPKTENYYQGYGFHFIVKSLGTETAKSAINDLSIYPFANETISGIRFTSNNRSINTALEKINFRKTANFYYSVNLNDLTAKYLVMDQAFHPGWIAVVDGRILDHILVNNWANGWTLRQGSASQGKITIIFWPQYLEYIGFGLLAIAFIVIWKRN